MTLTVIKTFSSDDINKLNEDLWRTIYTKGNELHFGSVDEPKNAREIFAVIQLYGKALKDLYMGVLPKVWQFGEASQRVYINMLKDPDPGDQPYTYGERLRRYPTWDGESTSFEVLGTYFVNQMENLREALRETIKTGIQSNRLCGVIWNPLDINLKDPPCFNWFQLRLSEENNVSLRTLFRSRDFGNASFANWGAIIRAFRDEVIDPAGGILEELICVSTSAHLYNTDFDMIESLIGKVPDHMKRFLR